MSCSEAAPVRAGGVGRRNRHRMRVPEARIVHWLAPWAMADGACLSTAPTKPVDPPEAALTIPSGHELREGLLALEAPLPLHFGGVLDGVEIAWRLVGAKGAPVVAVLGGISSGSNVCAVRAAEFGWWDERVGPGK